jgi:hypothetical protein
MNICKICSKSVPLVGGITLRLSGEEDIHLCPKHGALMAETIRNTVFSMGMNEITQSTAGASGRQSGGYAALTK